MGWKELRWEKQNLKNHKKAWRNWLKTTTIIQMCWNVRTKITNKTMNKPRISWLPSIYSSTPPNTPPKRKTNLSRSNNFLISAPLRVLRKRWTTRRFIVSQLGSIIKSLIHLPGIPRKSLMNFKIVSDNWSRWKVTPSGSSSLQRFPCLRTYNMISWTLPE